VCVSSKTEAPLAPLLTFTATVIALPVPPVIALQPLANGIAVALLAIDQHRGRLLVSQVCFLPNPARSVVCVRRLPYSPPPYVLTTKSIRTCAGSVISWLCCTPPQVEYWRLIASMVFVPVAS